MYVFLFSFLFLLSPLSYSLSFCFSLFPSPSRSESFVTADDANLVIATNGKKRKLGNEERKLFYTLLLLGFLEKREKEREKKKRQKSFFVFIASYFRSLCRVTAYFSANVVFVFLYLFFFFLFSFSFHLEMIFALKLLAVPDRVDNMTIPSVVYKLLERVYFRIIKF